MVRPVLNLRSTGRKIDFRSPRFGQRPYASRSHTHVPLSPSSIIWYRSVSRRYPQPVRRDTM